MSDLENLEKILACVLLIIKLCSAVLPLISTIQSLIRKHKGKENKKAISVLTENAENI